MMKKELKLNIENFLKNSNKRFFNLSNEEIFQKIQFKFMRNISELSENFEDIEYYELIQKIRIEREFKNINYFSFKNFKNILHKKLNMRIFYYQSNDNEYQLYLSFNLNDRKFRNQKIENIQKKELIKILNEYSLKERKLRIS